MMKWKIKTRILKQNNKQIGVKGDNRGLSLVELLVAITIMAIVVSPFLHSFITAANTNTKAKIVLRATSVAENLMESMKGMTLENIAFELGNDVLFTPHDCELVSSYDSYYELLINENMPNPGEDAHYAISHSLDGWSFEGQTSNKYYYALTGIRQDGVKYDAAISIDASEYYSDDAGTNPGYNDQKLVQIAGLDLEQDLFYMLDETDNNRVYTEFEDRSNRYFSGSGSAKTANEFAGVLVREVIFDLNRIGTGKEVDLTIRYTAPSGWVAESERVYERTFKLMTDATGTKPLRNIYFLYIPNYDSIAGSVKDYIYINNPGKIDVDMYLIKQVSGDYSSLISKEMLYRTKVSLTETVAPTEINNPATTGIYSNFNINLGKFESGAADYFMPDQHEYAYNGTSGEAVKDKLRLGDLLNADSDNRMFKIEIKIYKQGAFDPATNTFDESKYLMKIG